jgi:hypothetical protein
MGCAVSSVAVRPSGTVGPDAAKEVMRASSFKTGVVTPLNATGFESKRIKCDKIEEEVYALMNPSTDNKENVFQGSNPRQDFPHVTSKDVDSHQADETGFLYRDVKNIVNPKNIIAAVKRGDLQTVKELCDRQLGSGESSVNALGACSGKEQKKLFQTIQSYSLLSRTSHLHLLTSIVISNLLGMWNSSPLMIATQYAQDEIANFLLDQDDVKIDHVNDNGVSTLLIACSGKYR